ncbi:hypothetical protein CcaverHIS641_0407560 [Cutaneotrichosporon cavernicola]|nr:hypothetical protein CcaverHIS641_0407560 [Cutaneotrichosporon cavernicola]
MSSPAASMASRHPIASAVKPDSQKSTLEKAGDFVKGKADTVAAAAQPTESKSTTQKISDAVSGKKV